MSDIEKKAAERLERARKMAKEVHDTPFGQEFARILYERADIYREELLSVGMEGDIDGVAEGIVLAVSERGFNNATVVCALAAVVATVIINIAKGVEGGEEEVNSQLGLEITAAQRAFCQILREQVSMKVAILATEMDEKKDASSSLN